MTDGDTNEKGQKKKKVTNDVMKPVAYAKDIEELARLVMEERNLDPVDALIQVGIQVLKLRKISNW